MEERTRIGTKAVSGATTIARRCYAKKFRNCIKERTNTKWDPEKDLVAPVNLLSDENISLYFTHLWTTHNPGKAQVENGKRYINYALAQYQKVSVGRRGAQSNYPITFTTLKGIQNTDRWRDNGSQGAKPLTKEEVMKIMLAPIQNLDDLRHKVMAICYLHMGYHKKDVQRLRETNIEDHPLYRNRNGSHKPKMVIRTTHNKRKCIPVRNVVACGCSGDHDFKNQFCEYAVWKLYIMKKKQHDNKNETEGFLRMNNKKKKQHFEEIQPGEEKVLKEVNFMRSLSTVKNEYQHRNMGIHKIGDALEYWNRKLNLRPDSKITADMARKTFCTLGAKFFKFSTEQIRAVTHHMSDENFEIYLCPEYEDLEEESHISVTMQKWEKKKYQPPVHLTPAVMLYELQQTLGSMQRMMLLQNKTIVNNIMVCVCVCV